MKIFCEIVLHYELISRNLDEKIVKLTFSYLVGNERSHVTRNLLGATTFLFNHPNLLMHVMQKRNHNFEMTNS